MALGFMGVVELTVLLRWHAHMLLYKFAEKGRVGKVELIGQFFHGLV